MNIGGVFPSELEYMPLDSWFYCIISIGEDHLKGFLSLSLSRFLFLPKCLARTVYEITHPFVHKLELFMLS